MRPGAEPDLIILNEPVSALDLSLVRHVTDRVAVMYLGRVIETGSTEDIFDRPLHPYTAAVMSDSPKLDPYARPEERIVLRVELPSPLDPPSGCRFRTRRGRCRQR